MKELTLEEFFKAEADYTSAKLKRCRTCIHRMRYELNERSAKVVQCCSLPGVVAKQCGDVEDGMHSRLNPLFVEEMMGFPYGWTIYPFLKQNGEPKP